MPQDEDELRRRCADGELLPNIARAMGRTQSSVQNRAALLGVPCRSR